MNIIKKFQFACTECGTLTRHQNKRIVTDGCVRRRICDKCGNTYVLKYNKNDEIVEVLNAYKKVKI